LGSYSFFKFLTVT